MKQQNFVDGLKILRPIYHLGPQAFQAAISFWGIIPDRIRFTPGAKEQLEVNT
jgi:hypothetical protein